MGEPFSLTDIVYGGCSPTLTKLDPVNGRARMHFALPETIDRNTRNIPNEMHDAPFEDDEGILPQKKGVFTTLEPHVQEALLRTYFDWFDPAYPLINKEEFVYRLRTNQLSLLLLQAVYFIAATHCDSTYIVAAGFNTRHAARLAFYKRAKALYDADYETDAVTIVQALFLMSFWWGGPIDQKDTWHWLGAAIGLAQTKGMHRS